MAGGEAAPAGVRDARKLASARRALVAARRGRNQRRCTTDSLSRRARCVLRVQCAPAPPPPPRTRSKLRGATRNPAHQHAQWHTCGLQARRTLLVAGWRVDRASPRLQEAPLTAWRLRVQCHCASAWCTPNQVACAAVQIANVAVPRVTVDARLCGQPALLLPALWFDRQAGGGRLLGSGAGCPSQGRGGGGSPNASRATT